MKMKKYQNPEMEVVELKSQVALLAVSGEVVPGCLTQCGEDED